MIMLIVLLAVFGICVSIYSYYVERKLKMDAAYKPACDLSDIVSCSKPLKSKYSNLFFVSNTLAGICYYLLVGFAAYMNAHKILLALTFAGLIMTVELAYLLYFKVRAVCLLCTSIYIINLLLFIAALRG